MTGFEVRRSAREPIAPWIAVLAGAGVLAALFVGVLDAEAADLWTVAVVCVYALARLASVLLWPGVGELDSLVDEHGVTAHQRRFLVPWQWAPSRILEWDQVRTGMLQETFRGDVGAVALTRRSKSMWKSMIDGPREIHIAIARGDRSLEEVIAAIDSRAKVIDPHAQPPLKPSRVPG